MLKFLTTQEFKHKDIIFFSRRFIVAKITTRADKKSACTKDKEPFNFTDVKIIIFKQTKLGEFHPTGWTNFPSLRIL